VVVQERVLRTETGLGVWGRSTAVAFRRGGKGEERRTGGEPRSIEESSRKIQGSKSGVQGSPGDGKAHTQSRRPRDMCCERRITNWRLPKDWNIGRRKKTGQQKLV